MPIYTFGALHLQPYLLKPSGDIPSYSNFTTDRIFQLDTDLLGCRCPNALPWAAAKNINLASIPGITPLTCMCVRILYILIYPLVHLVARAHIAC